MSDQCMPSGVTNWINVTSMEHVARGIEVQFDTNTGKFRYRTSCFGAFPDPEDQELLCVKPIVVGKWVDGRPSHAPTCPRLEKANFMD